MRASGKLGVFGCRQFPFEPIEQAIHYLALALVQWSSGELFPKTGFTKDPLEINLSAVDGPAQASQKPVHPWCYVHGGLSVRSSALGSLQDVVIGVSLLPDLRRHAIETLRASFGSRQRHIGDCAGDSSIAIFKGMQGYKPQVCERSLHYRVACVLPVEPFEKRFHFSWDQRRGWRFKVNRLAVLRARDHLHGTCTIDAPTAGLDLAHAAPAGWKQCCLPAEQPGRRERLVI